MINLKALALTTVLALTSATPALALTYPGQGGRGGNDGTANQHYCAFTFDSGDRFLDKDIHPCTVTSRINGNGHKVWDIQTKDLKTTVVLWNDGTAEYWQEGERYTGTWGNMDGHTVVFDSQNSYNFAF